MAADSGHYHFLWYYHMSQYRFYTSNYTIFSITFLLHEVERFMQWKWYNIKYIKTWIITKLVFEVCMIWFWRVHDFILTPIQNVERPIWNEKCPFAFFNRFKIIKRTLKMSISRIYLTFVPDYICIFWFTQYVLPKWCCSTCCSHALRLGASSAIAISTQTAQQVVYNHTTTNPHTDTHAISC